nr:uncharacterized protein LOC111837179 [Paramormyrops kingsleyae]
MGWTEADMSVMTVLNGGEENGCEVGVNVEEVKGEGENRTGNVLGCIVSQGGRILLEIIEEEGPEEEEDTDLAFQEAQDADVATAERWQYMAAYIARTWLETSQGEEAEEDEENDVAFQEAEDADVVRLQVMVAHGERSWLETIPEEGAEEEEDTKGMMVDEIKEDAVEKTTGEELSFNVNAEDQSGDGTEKSQKKKKKKKKMKCAFFCCPFSFWKK